MCTDWRDVVQNKKDSCVKLFTRHPAQVGESYCQHLTYAVGLGGKLVGLGCAAVVHGVCPFWLSTFVSDRLPSLSRDLNSRHPRGTNGTETHDDDVDPDAAHAAPREPPYHLYREGAGWPGSDRGGSVDSLRRSPTRPGSLHDYTGNSTDGRADHVD